MAKIDPIDRAAVIDTLRNCLETKWFGSIEASMHYRDSIEFAISCINAAPTLDVQPVRRGEWEKEPYLFGWTHRCNRCGENFGMPHGMFNFCPHCGADMRKVSERDQFAGMGGYGGR